MIVKVQLSISTSEPHRMMLVYSEDRSVFYQGRATDEVTELMGRRLKAYFHAYLGEYGKVFLNDDAPEQDW